MSAWLTKALAAALVASLGVLALPARAVDWQELGKSVEGDMWYLDADSVKRDRSLVLVWVNLQPKSPKWREELNAYEASTYLNWAVDCGKQQFAATRYVGFDAADEVIIDETAERPEWVFEDMPEGSLVYSAAEYACTVLGRRVGPVDQAAIELLESSNWIKLGSDADGDYFVGKFYREVDADVGGVLERIVFSEPQLIEGRTVTNMVLITGMSCQERKTVTILVKMFNLSGVAVHEYEPHEEPEPPEPDSARAAALAMYCMGELTSDAGEGQTGEASPRASGTGFLTERGYFATAHHVVADANRIHVIGLDGERIPARVVLADEANDIALLLAERLPIAALGLPASQSTAGLGSRVFTIGFPHVELLGFSPKMAAGEVSGTRGLRDDPRHLQISVPVQSGNSGGPLVNARGEVVGVVTSKLDASAVEEATGDLPQNVNYAIKGRYLRFLLSDLPGRPVPVLKAQPDWSLEEITREVKRAVVLILVE